MIHQIWSTQKHCHQILYGTEIVWVFDVIAIIEMDGKKFTPSLAHAIPIGGSMIATKINQNFLYTSNVCMCVC